MMQSPIKCLLPAEVPGAHQLKPGGARCPARSVQEIVNDDALKPPAVLRHEHYQFLGNEDIPFDRYTSMPIFEQEIEKIWKKTWQWACREEHIRNPGDYYVYQVAHLSFLIVRTRSGGIKGYYNSCLHRGTKLRAQEGMGSANDLRCPYHGWTWSLDGNLKSVPCAWDFPHVDTHRFKLPEVHVATWGGFVFINMQDDPPSLDQYLGVLPEHFRNWGMENRYVELHMAKELPCNWKTAQEAFLESYHVFETHPQLLQGVGDANVQYDTYGDHVSRFYAASGVNSPHLDAPLSEQDLVSVMMVGDRSVLDQSKLKVQPGENARIVMARFLRKQLGEKYKTDLSGFSDSEMIDTIEYNVFPNMFLFPGLSLPMVYRFRPIGRDPHRCLFDLLFLRPLPSDGERPEPANVVFVKEDDSYSTVPGMDPAFGAVYDQDTNNLRAQQQGFMASKKGAQTLGNYQEVRIRHLQQTFDKYMTGVTPAELRA
jgi:phenylpropionate dioxygenase-like ring-hydroxylating dioxygenase large terminal subunit